MFLSVHNEATLVSKAGLALWMTSAHSWLPVFSLAVGQGTLLNFLLPHRCAATWDQRFASLWYPLGGYHAMGDWPCGAGHTLSICIDSLGQPFFFLALSLSTIRTIIQLDCHIIWGLGINVKGAFITICSFLKYHLSTLEREREHRQKSCLHRWIK